MTLSANPDAALSPTWRPPKAPLPPHRLAKLANALGVSTPVPANAFSLSRSFSDSSGPMDHLRRSPTPFRRSPTPSTATSSVGFYPPSTSKFMLHVIPPLHLPHDSDTLDDDSDMTPPPASASGYHTQFRRGTLVPLYSNFQAQLGAIAKEYALPSTVGLILYLVTTTQFQPTSPEVAPTEEPGPRLSEDIWKHILARVLQAEQREEALLPSPNSTPRLLGLGIGARSTPYLPQESAGHLRPFLSSPGGVEPIQPQPTYPFTPAPSTPSSASDIRSSSKSAPPSSTSDEPGTPDTSIGGSARADSFDLPGLHSPSLIPILAKVEFDIDRRRAGWYDPWIRSRKANHAKRAGSRASGRSKSQDDEESHGPTPHIRLLIGRKQTASPISLNSSPANDNAEEEVVDDVYEPLSEASEDGEDEDVAEDATARVSSLIGGKDPLEDVFGSDPDTWADIHSESNHNTRDTNPNITNLALTGADLSTISDLEDDRIAGREEDEVEALLEQMSRPNLAISMPGSPQLNQKRSSSPSTQSSSRRHVPPPLVLVPQNQPTIPQEPTPVPESSSNTDLAYLETSSPDFSDHDLEEEFDEYTSRVRSPSDSQKRGGAVFGDLDLGLDPSEDFDDTDPHDRRRSQYLMRAQLDEIERTLAQLSPRILKADLEEEHNQSFHSATFSPKAPSLTLSPGGNTRNSDFFPASPRLPKHPDPPSPPSNASWPAVPFSSMKEKPEQGLAPVNGPPSPPQLAVNGITTSAPRSYVSRVPTDQPSAESEFRRRELEEEQSLYPPQSARSADSSASSSVIPLSPDPFGRYPSTPDMAGGSRLSANQWEFVNMGRGPAPLGTVIEGVEPPSQVQGRARSGTTSRFSTDSVTTEEPSKPSNRATLMSVKSIKKLWRKSSNKDKDKAPPPAPPSSAPSSGRASPQPPPQRPERPSQEHQEFPDVPALPPTPLFGRFSPQPPPPPSHHPHPSQDLLHIQQSRPSQDLPMPPHIPQDQLALPPPPSQQLSVPFQSRNLNGNKASPIIPTQMLPSRTGSTLDRLHFDQESPYPIRHIRQSPRPASPPPLPPMPDKDRVVRKSILKSWKSSSSGNAAPPPVAEPRSSIERQNGPPRAGGRRPSVVASSRTSVTSPDLPPSPQIPEHFINGKNGPPPPADHRQSTRSRLTTSSTDSSHSPPERQRSLGTTSSSPSRSMASSRSSQETRPSFDVSQFEVVSPKMNSTLSYPYHTLDHETDGHGPPGN